jgi:hypothetical protein
MASDNSVPLKRIRGKREMKELALAAVTALVDADLSDLIDELQTRVFSKGAALLFDTTQVGEHEWHWSYKPMVELLLLDIHETVATTHLTASERRDRIRWALEIAGF